MKKANLYLFIGASSAGKSALAKEIVRQNPTEFEIMVKGTTRPTRPEPQPDNVFDQRLKDIRNNSEFNIYYANGDTAYGVNQADIEQRLAGGKSQILVVNDALTIEFLKRDFRGLVTTVFIHRDLTTEMMELVFRQRGEPEEKLALEVIKRETTRSIIYEQLAGGLLVPDYTIINYGNSLDPAVKQFLLITQKGETTRKQKKTKQKGMFQIILSGTGPFKDNALRMFETVPGGAKYIVPKFLSRDRRDDDGVETVNGPPPSTALQYQFFGKDYAIDAEDALARLRAYGYAVCTVANCEVARSIQRIVAQAGFGCQLTYLHQPVPDLSNYPVEERTARAIHYQKLLDLYTGVLILDSKPLIPISGKADLSRWAQRQLLEHTKG